MLRKSINGYEGKYEIDDLGNCQWEIMATFGL